MKIKKILVFLFILLVVTGCNRFFMICSLNPFYLEKNITLEDEIEGNWKLNIIEADEVPLNNSHSTNVWGKSDTLYVWKIKRFATTTKYRTNSGRDSLGYNMPEKYYMVEMKANEADTAIFSFKLVLFRINNILYGDFTPDENTSFGNSLFITSNFFRVHTLARIKPKNNGFELSFLGDDTMEQLIMERRVRIKYKWAQDTKRLLFTAPSKELTAMIERYGTNKRFIDWDTQSTMLTLKPLDTDRP